MSVKPAYVSRGEIVTEYINFRLETCCACSVPFFIPEYLYKRLVNNPGEGFYCPNGHGQHYTGKSEDQKKIEQLQKQMEWDNREKERLTNELLDTISNNKKLERQLKRVHKGVCPCCNRTFVNLQKHMETKHPETNK